jgi:hypothetical protein
VTVVQRAYPRTLIQFEYFLTSNAYGLKDLVPHNKPFAHDVPQTAVMDAIKIIKLHVLIGATGAPGAFTEVVIRLIADIKRQP